MCDPSADREYLIEIDGSVAWDRLVFRWSYSEERHERMTIEVLARNMMAELRSIIHNCRFGEGAGVTPGHFPAARIDQDDLQRLLAKLQSLDKNDL
jgi:non-ribosomal peptide synthase protein (TIGR01720 family)